MIFSSLLFIYAFLPVSLGLYYITPKNLRNYTLMFLSIIYCGMCSLYFLSFIVAFVLINYLIGLAIDLSGKIKAVSAMLLTIGIIADLSVFILFKTQIFDEYIDRLKVLNLIAPVGVSFFVLSAVGYLIDVFRKKIKAEKNIMSYALFIMFFPKLSFGPVISYSGFSKMLSKRTEGLAEIGIGLSIFVKGLAKKVLLADNLYLLYSAVSSMDVDKLSALSSWLGVLAYMLCLYFTLSGLSDMSIGIARCFGFKLPLSFNYPFVSLGINDFCMRWHTPVVRWFKRYVANPLTEGTSNKIFRYIIFLAMWGLISLWYDVSINTLICGLLIGIAAIIEEVFFHKRAIRPTAMAYTIFITAICSVFFFGDSMNYSFHYFLAMIGGNNNIADNVSFYLLKSYIVVLLVSTYAATDLFRNLIERSKKRVINITVGILSPVCMVLLLAVCTAVISYSGSSEMLLLKL